MKNYIILILVLISLMSCKQQTPSNYVLLSGNIGNTKGGELIISNLMNGFSKTINVKDTGEFLDTLFIPENSQYEFRYEMGRTYPYLSMGDEVNMHVKDAKEFLKTISFEGNYSELNNFIAFMDNEDFNFRVNQEKTYHVDEAAFEDNLNDFKKRMESKLDEVSKIPKYYKANLLRIIEIKRIRLKSIYETIYARLTENKNFKASDTFKREINDFDLYSEENYKISADYREMVSFHLMNKINASEPKDIQSYRETRKKVLSEINSEVIRNGELYRNILNGLKRAEDKEKIVNEFLNASTNESHKATVMEQYKLLKVLDPGQPSPKFVNYENYDGSTTSLDDLQGKYVYIDVWATWCGPCKAQIPYLKEVEEKYHGKNITFVSLSTDKQKNKQKWRNMVKDMDLGGIQLITDNDFNSSFIREYKISGIPRFILLDPKGNIVTANAPKPSDKELLKLFDQLSL
ncbi:TlpA family protein disulfide reductase [Flavobacteriaceae bacterium F08102]|nr:TlpA family protein disulfide reductase [Flavobacteriaceae bacterium F08102]